MICTCPLVSGGHIDHRIECPLVTPDALRKKLAEAETRFPLRDIVRERKRALAAESREKALAAENKALREALREAARSLEWIAQVQPPTEVQPSVSDLRQYAASRASVARAVLATGDKP